jgi:crossover junction endodeoxyribonuclease RuvC
MFKLGMGYGLWMALIATLQLPNTLVGAPVAWKRSAGLLGRDKDASRQRAQPRFPRADLAHTKDPGRGEALCIAYPGLRHPLV